MQKSLAFLLVALTTFIAFRYTLSFAKIDPDRYYHLRLSQITADEGIQKTLPQAEDIGWGESFPDKEFLFHLLTSGLHFIGGEVLVEWFPFFLLLGILLVLLNIQWHYAPVWVATGLTFLAVLCSSHFIMRMSLLRPHVLAVFIFAIMLLGFIKRNNYTIVLSCFGFALAYHAIYVPLVVIGIFCFFRYLDGDRSILKILVYSTLALIAGTILSPYFPGNFVMTVQHLKIAAGLVEINKGLFGAELQILPTDKFLKSFGFVFVSVVCQSISLYFNWNSARRSNCLSVFVGTLVFTGLMFLSPRASAYAVPFSMIGLTYCLLDLGKIHKTMPWIFLVLLTPFGHYSSKVYLAIPKSNRSTDEKFRAVEELTNEDAKVFNCSWSDSPFIYYKKPALRWVDLLDPSFLHQHQQGVFDLRYELIRGRVADPYIALKEVFKADYVFCSRNATFEREPNLTRIFPKSLEEMFESSAVVYRVGEERRPQQVLNYKYKMISETKLGNILNIKFPEDLSDAYTWPDEEFVKDENYSVSPSYVSFRIKYEMADSNSKIAKLYKNYDENTDGAKKELYDGLKEESVNFQCFAVEVSPTEIERLSGSDVMAIGGGAHLQVYLNEKKLFVSEDVFSYPRPVVKTLVLERPLNSSDEIKAVVCSQASRKAGFQLSLWKYEDLREHCKPRLKLAGWKTDVYREWPDTKLDLIRCLQ